MIWAHPIWFNGFWLIIALALFILWTQQRRHRALEQFVNQTLWGRLVHVSRRSQRFKISLILLAILFLILGLARPQRQGQLVKVERQGIDLMVVLDTSASMLAGDFKPNRFVKAKREISSLIERLKGDRIGVVAFSGVSFLQCPLTLDYRAAKLFLEAMAVDMLPRPGTAIGDAIRTAIKGLDNKESKHRVILLITDGEDHESRPLEAAEQAKAMGIKIYCIGVGKPEGEPIPIVDVSHAERGTQGKITGYKKDEEGNVILSRLGEAALQQMALTTGGAYYRATASELELDRIYDEIEKMEKGKFEEEYVTKYEDQFFWLLWVAFLLLCIEMAIGERGYEDQRSNDPSTGWVPRGERKDRVISVIASPNEARAKQSHFSFDLRPYTFLLFCLLIAWKLPVEHRNAKANELYQKGQYDQALQVYQDAETDAPEKPELHYNAGNALYQQKKYPDSKEAYQQALAAGNPKLRAHAYYNLASAYFREGNLRESLRLFEKALELDPKDEDTRYNIELIKKLLEKQPPPPPEQKQEEKQQQREQQQEKEGGKGAEGNQKKQEQNGVSHAERGTQKPQEQKEQPKEQPKQEEQNQTQAAQPEQGQEKEQSGGPQEIQGEMSRQDAQRVLDALEEQPSEVGKLLRYHFPKSQEPPPGKDW